MTAVIPCFRPSLKPSDFLYIKEILRSGRVAGGPLTRRLEREISASIASADACATSSGTAALHLTLLALGVRPGDGVLIPSFCCVAVLQALRHAGAVPLFMDIDPDTLNPTPDTAKKALRARAKALILTHTAGFPTDVSAFRKLGLPIVEDCCLAAGASIGGRPVGSTGDAAVFSFYATKPVCGGEGGMACAKDRRVLARIRDLNDYDQRDDFATRHNYKMSDLTAGLALAQWRRLGALIGKRRVLAARYRSAGRFAADVLPTVPRGAKPTYQLFPLKVAGVPAFIRAGRRLGIVCDRPVFRPLHRYWPSRSALPGTDLSWRRYAALPLYPALTARETKLVLSGIGRLARAGHWKTTGAADD